MIFLESDPTVLQVQCMVGSSMVSFAIKGSSKISDHMASCGVPSSLNSVLIISISVLQVQSGFPNSSSLMTQPAPQMSMDSSYLEAPNNSSGGRYHNDITLGVNGTLYLRLSPKSANFSSPSYNKLASFKSRCIMLRACINSSAEKSCNKRRLT